MLSHHLTNRHYYGILKVGEIKQIVLLERNARIIDRQADMRDPMYSYTDLVAGLERTPNYAGPPVARLYRYAPKCRIHGLNPSWMMDWESFAKELEAAEKRKTEPIPA
jgi:hypothetical protein